MALGIGAGLIGASVLGSLLGNKKGTTVNQGPLETPEQTEARKLLLGIGKSNLNYGGSLGDFNMTDAENMSQNKLMQFLSGGNPAIFGSGVNELNKLFSTDTFNPYEEGGVYAGFKEQNALNTADAMADLKRNAKFSKNLYSTDTIQNLGRVEQQGNLNLQNKLADLYQGFVDRKLNAIPLALQAGQAQQSLDLNAINAGAAYGALPRTLKTAEDQAKYGEFVRSQGAGTDALKGVLGSQPPYGASSYTMPASSGPWGKVLDTLAYGGGMLLANQYGTPTSTLGAGGGGGASMNLYEPWQQPYNSGGQSFPWSGY